MCMFFFYEITGQLLANMQRSTFQASEHVNSIFFSSVENTLVSSIGVDKGGNNLLATIRNYTCRRRTLVFTFNVQCASKVQLLSVMRTYS